MSQQRRLIGVSTGTTHCCPCHENLLWDGARRGEALFRLSHLRTSFQYGRSTSSRRGEMEILYPQCAGLDVHKKTVRVCVLIQQEHGKPHKEFRTYGTTTQDLLQLQDWLLEQRCTHVA